MHTNKMQNQIHSYALADSYKQELPDILQQPTCMLHADRMPTQVKAAYFSFHSMIVLSVSKAFFKFFW